MTLTITSLRVDGRGTEVPFLIVNCTFKCAEDPENYDFLRVQAKGDSEEYRKVLTIDDPEKYLEFIMDWDLNSRTPYPGYGRAWTHQDPVWQYIEKFDTFWFREWIADCPVTRAIVADLKYYKEHGKLPTVYRSVDEGIILQHLRTLQSYWD
jgi:hypothetical protein